MFDLPSTTEFGKRIPKQRFYENISVSPTLKRVFVEQIQSIVWANKIAPSTINVAIGKEVTEIEVFRISITTDTVDISALRQLDKQIPYHILFVLEYDGKYQMWIGYKEVITTGSTNAFKVNDYYHSEWFAEQDLHIKLDGLNMDMLYENLVRSVGNIEKSQVSTLSEQLADNEQRDKLRKEIEQLTKKMNSEKQPKKKLEIRQQLSKLKLKL